MHVGYSCPKLPEPHVKSRPVLATSAHSHIEEYNKQAHGEWEWMEWNG